MKAEAPHAPIVAHYERCLAKHGDTHRGVDWPNAADAITRYQTMLGLLPSTPKKKTLLDFGCGAGHLYDEVLRANRHDIDYRGLDVSNAFVTAARTRHSNVPFERADVLDPDATWGAADYVVMNGVFTEKRELPFEAMYKYLFDVLDRVWARTNDGLAFNVMSTVVDWERDDLFHVPLDRLIRDVARRLSRHIVVRHDYGLYEYTLYVYRRPPSCD